MPRLSDLRPNKKRRRKLSLRLLSLTPFQRLLALSIHRTK